MVGSTTAGVRIGSHSSGEKTPPIHDVVFQALTQALPRAESHKVPGAGHGVARDQPGAFNALVLDFLARHGLQP